MWACHGPSGQNIDKAPVRDQADDGQWTELGGGCGADAGGAPAGYTLSFKKPDPAAGSRASITFALPGGLSTSQVKLNHTARGFDGTTGYSYTVNGQPANGSAVTLNSAENSVTLQLSCSSGCSGSPAVDIVSVAALVTDTTAPTGGVNRNSPVDKGMPILPYFNDSGVGLDYAVVSVDGYPQLTQTRKFGTVENTEAKTLATECSELSPGDATNDRPLNTARCQIDRATFLRNDPVDGIVTNPIVFDSTQLPEGIHKRNVTVFDAAGNATPVIVGEEFEVWHPPAPVSVRTLNISTASVTEQPGSNPGTQPPGGGVQGAQRNQCRSPRLSVTLRSKPVRVSKNVPVLKYKKKYRFTGRLTCVINGKRQSAPKRTKLSILNKVGKKTVRKPNTAIRSKGAVDLKLAFVSSRTVIFRYTNADGQKSEVKIKVRITKKKK